MFHSIYSMVYGVYSTNGCHCFALQRSVLGANELLFFADICAGPGGFTEYLLYRTKWHAKGYGFTLKGEQSSFTCCIRTYVLMYRMYRQICIQISSKLVHMTLCLSVYSMCHVA